MLIPIFNRISLPIIRSYLQCGESKTSALMLPIMAFPNCGNLTCSSVTLLLELKLPMVVVVLFAVPLFGTVPKGKLVFLINVWELPESSKTVNDLCGSTLWIRVAVMYAIGATSTCICCLSLLSLGLYSVLLNKFNLERLFVLLSIGFLKVTLLLLFCLCGEPLAVTWLCLFSWPLVETRLSLSVSSSIDVMRWCLWCSNICSRATPWSDRNASLLVVNCQYHLWSE